MASAFPVFYSYVQKMTVSYETSNLIDDSTNNIYFSLFWEFN
jgi:hypothetical protein